MIAKVCTKCGIEKPLDDFYRNRTKKHGRDSRCKTCHNAAHREYIKTPEGQEAKKRASYRYIHSDKGKRTRNRYAQSERGKRVHRKAIRKYQKSKKGREVQKRVDRKQRKKHPERIKARMAIRDEVEAGHMPRIHTQICVDCGNQAQSYHHYKGYDRAHWLDVIPLCLKCDKKYH